MPSGQSGTQDPAYNSKLFWHKQMPLLGQDLNGHYLEHCIPFQEKGGTHLKHTPFKQLAQLAVQSIPCPLLAAIKQPKTTINIVVFIKS